MDSISRTIATQCPLESVLTEITFPGQLLNKIAVPAEWEDPWLSNTLSPH